MSRFDVVFFDLFFTLILPKYLGADDEHDVLGLTRAAWEEKAEAGEFLRLRYLGAVSDPLAIAQGMARSTGLPHRPEQVREILRRRTERIRRCMQDIHPQVAEALAELRRRGKRLCIVSNADAIDLLPWAESPLRNMVDCAVFSCEAGCAKPDAEIYRIALARVGAAPGRCAFVGDGGSQELRGAKEVGLTTVLAEHFRVDACRNDLFRYADYRVDDMNTLVNLLCG